jgi:hypothetical protein
MRLEKIFLSPIVGKWEKPEKNIKIIVKRFSHYFENQL